MKFSRFFKDSFIFFFFLFLVNSARPLAINDSLVNTGYPIFSEIPSIPLKAQSFYTSLFVDKGNRLFITTDQELYIYDGVILQQIKIPGKPIISSNQNGEIALSGDRYLAMLRINKSGGYSINYLIDSTTLGVDHHITSLGLGNRNIYFATGSKLWIYKDKPMVVDSSAQTIRVFNSTLR